MTIVVNNTSPTENKESNFFIGVTLLVGFAVILFYFGLPLLKRMDSTQSNLPSAKVVIPDKINVNEAQKK
jgi:hypothetical protein